MKRIYWAVLLSILLVGCTYQQIVKLDVPAPSAAVPASTIDSLQTQYQGFDAYFQDYFSSIEHCVTMNDWNTAVIVHCSYVLLNPNGSHSAFEMSAFNTNTVESSYIHVTYPDGQYREFSLNDCHVEKSNGLYHYKLSFPNATPGMKVEYGWEQRLMFPYTIIFMCSEMAFDQSVPIHSLTFQRIYPEKWTYSLRQTSPETMAKFTTHKTPNGKSNILVYHDNDFPGRHEELFSQSPREAGKFLDLVPKVFKFSPLFGGSAISYKGPESWAAEVLSTETNAYRLGSGDMEAMKQKAFELTKNCTQPLERADSILAYVQREIDVESGGGTNDSYKDILKHKKGDYLQTLGMTCTLMQCADLDAFVALAHSVTNGPFDENFIERGQIEVPVIVIYSGDSCYVASPVKKFRDLQVVPAYLAGQPAVALMGFPEQTHTDGTPYISNQLKNGEIITLPNRPAKDRLDDHLAIVIDPEGHLEVEQTTNLYAEEAADIRETLGDCSDDAKTKEFCKSYIQFLDSDYTLESYSVRNLHEYGCPLQVVMRYRVDNLVSVTSNEAVFKLDGVLNCAIVPPNSTLPAERHNPICVGQNVDNLRMIEITYPDDWALTSTLPEVNFADSLVSVHGIAHDDGHKLSITQEFQLFAGEYPVSEYPALLRLGDVNGGFTSSWLTFERNQPQP